MKEIIGLCGYAGSGKDTAAAHMPGWTRVSFADGVREVALAIDPIVYFFGINPTPQRLSEFVNSVGWDHAKKEPETRRLLQRVGTEAGRNILGEHVWVNLAARKIGDIEGPAVITDCRFPNEVNAIKALGGFIIRIKRPGIGPVNDHPSETAIDHIEADAEVVNDGTPEELGAKVLAALTINA